MLKSELYETLHISYIFSCSGAKQMLLEVEAPRISRQLAHVCGMAVSPINWPPLPPGNIPGTHFC